jgi:hypothetical protein
MKWPTGIQGLRYSAAMTESVQQLQMEVWPIDRFVFYARNPRKNDTAVDRMCSSIREFGFKVPSWPATTARSSTVICA